MSKNRNIVTAFRKSSASSATGNNDCVEVAQTADGGRAIRDSKAPHGPVLFFAPAEWNAFSTGVNDGEFGG
ncbi:DUF397 domain-containing protein [Streptomyces sp. NBC_00576]|uniref:DUF397 domain-containing protein n=1 Tax=Streptomyces sp. NBC_00576 TaxID=2903665 RepID=UPI002E81CBC9|nr:DUF397 domain-containing protein [Streptomyces sp. NBC_00576]WUB71424.1 DUF397 domain-containing protein [Streptomyces sp. NBC_00576]